MSQETIISNTEVSFKDFLFKNKRNRTILWIAAVAIVIQWAVFKYFYPFASFIHGDSFAYINAAEKNLDINTYLIGYSKFLRLFSVFNRTDYILTSFQFLTIHISSQFLLFSLFYFYKLGKVSEIIILSFMVFNPLFLHLGNLISSDGLFLALSLTWFALLIWIIHRPSMNSICLHAIILFIAFTVRYNAMIYPAIAILAFLLSRMSRKEKIIGLSMVLILCGSFAVFTIYKYKKLTGYWQYSPFSGWQWANNAMYAYRYVDSVSRKPVPKKFEELDNMIRQYFDSTRDVNRFPHETLMASTVYMWSPSLPLFKYRNRIYKDTTLSEFKKWATIGPMYREYGQYIIKQYPSYYLRYYIWPNFNKYFAPPVEFLQSYNSGKSKVTSNTKGWFGYRSLNVKARTKDHSVKILNFYPILSGVINTVILISLIGLLLIPNLLNDTPIRNLVILGYSMWAVNAAFTIVASSAALRFQSFPIILTVSFCVFIIDHLSKSVKAGNDLGNIPNNTLNEKDFAQINI